MQKDSEWVKKRQKTTRLVGGQDRRKVEVEIEEEEEQNKKTLDMLFNKTT